MTTDPSVFGEGNSEQETPENKTYAGKYSSVEELEKGYTNASGFIETLKAEKRELEERLQKIRDQETSEQFTKQVKEDPPKKVDQPTDEKQLADLVDNLLSKKLRQAELDSQFTKFENDLVDHFGSLAEAQKAVKSKASELGYSVKQIEELARTNPNLVRQVVIGTSQPTQGGAPNKLVNESTAAAPKPASSEAEEFENMKAELRKNPNKTLDVKWNRRYHELYGKVKS